MTSKHYSDYTVYRLLNVAITRLSAKNSSPNLTPTRTQNQSTHQSQKALNLPITTRSKTKTQLARLFDTLIDSYHYEENVNKVRKTIDMSKKVIKTTFDVIDKMTQNQEDIQVGVLMEGTDRDFE